MESCLTPKWQILLLGVILNIYNNNNNNTNNNNKINNKRALRWDRLAPQPTTGTWTLPLTRVRGDTFGTCQQPQGHPR